jgi:Fe-S-cluster containining protein
MAAPTSLCARCARQGKTCCQGRDIFVTAGDVDRIAAFSHRRGFYEYRAACDSAYEDQEDDPIWQRHVFRPDRSRRVLKRRSNGDCCFLGPDGCRLPLEHRPLVCRLHPHTYTAEALGSEFAADCPIHLLPPGGRLEDAVAGGKAVEAEHWRRQLYAEITASDGR